MGHGLNLEYKNLAMFVYMEIHIYENANIG